MGFKLEDSKITKIPSRAETDQYSQLWMRSNLCRLHLTCRMRKIPMIMDMFAERAVSIGCWFDQEPWKGLLWYRKHCKKGDEIYYEKSLEQHWTSSSKPLSSLS